MTAKTTQWWADFGPDTCEVCSVTYYAETGYYCALCDSALCSSCGVTLVDRRLVVCIDCSERGES